MDCGKTISVHGTASDAAELPQCRQSCGEQEQPIRNNFRGFAVCKHDAPGELCLLQLPEPDPSTLISTELLA